MVMLMGVGLRPLLVVFAGPVLTLAIRKEKSIKIRSLRDPRWFGGRSVVRDAPNAASRVFKERGMLSE